ncbi:MAG TPA: M1 family metallopeptidase, partial [Hymenobacter sp.]|nr:M1 family metallopeptidase [Hymenobacter sp.]
GQLRGVKLEENGGDGWGWTDIKSLRVRSSAGAVEDLTSGIAFIQPDDNNQDDQTVIRVPLRQPVQPGASVTVEIEFQAKLPKIFARTGFAGRAPEDRYFLVGQWFPKIGVYEAAGQRYAKQGQWNCHQFHANSEFYADYGVYDVAITVPQAYIVGATGLLAGEKRNPNGTKTLQYHAEDVVDFAWTASPRFLTEESQWQHVRIKLLLQPEHAAQANRYMESAKAALAYFDKHLGRYPYPNLTIVDPPFYGLGSGGMEYPTFITGGSVWNMPEGIKITEGVTAHEFGHQYFMGLLASNEFEEPWLDEGFNQYFEGRILDHTYGSQTSQFNLWGYRAGDIEGNRIGYVGLPNPKVAENFRYSWQYEELEAYGSLTYYKTATWLATLDRMVGRPVMDEIMQTYFERWKFKHPCARDFIAVANEVVAKRHGNRFGPNLNWYFDQVLYGTAVCDYKLKSISNNKVQSASGIVDQQGKKVLLETKEPNDKDKTGTRYRSQVMVERLGEMTLPVDVLVHFEDGREVRETWDGQARTRFFSYEGKHKVAWAKLDPQNKLLLDINLNNNSRAIEPETAPFWKYTVKFLFWVQNALQWMATLA